MDFAIFRKRIRLEMRAKPVFNPLSISSRKPVPISQSIMTVFIWVLLFFRKEKNIAKCYAGV